MRAGVSAVFSRSVGILPTFSDGFAAEPQRSQRDAEGKRDWIFEIGGWGKRSSVIICFQRFSFYSIPMGSAGVPPAVPRILRGTSLTVAVLFKRQAS